MTAVDIAPSRRRSRMHRASTGKRIELTERDIEIFKLLARYRFLRSTYIHAFVGGNKTKLIERLGHLYHEGGYLDRPEQQWEAVNARYMPVAYELAERGRFVLVDAKTDFPQRTDRARQYRHEALVCAVVASIEIESRTIPGLRFIPWEEILCSSKMPAATRNSPNPKAVSTRTASLGPAASGILGEADLVPDAVFGVEYAADGRKSFRFFALEVDRKTEPVFRSDNRQSSFARKLVQYHDLTQRSLYRARWGIPNLLVLTLTTCDRHMGSLLHAVPRIMTADITAHFLFRSVPARPDASVGASPIPGLLATPWHRQGLQPLTLAS
jgi:hypothetical protein